MTQLKDSVLLELHNIESEDDTTITYYMDSLPTLVDGAIAKVASFIYSNFPTSKDLYDYWATAGSQLSLDRIKVWPSDRDEVDSMTTMEALEYMLGDALPYLIAHGLLGSGVGLWEMFDQEFPDLHSIT
jgi:hypothetical protein